MIKNITNNFNALYNDLKDAAIKANDELDSRYGIRVDVAGRQVLFSKQDKKISASGLTALSGIAAVAAFVALKSLTVVVLNPLVGIALLPIAGISLALLGGAAYIVYNKTVSNIEHPAAEAEVDANNTEVDANNTFEYCVKLGTCLSILQEVSDFIKNSQYLNKFNCSDEFIQDLVSDSSACYFLDHCKELKGIDMKNEDTMELQVLIKKAHNNMNKITS